MSQKLWKRPLPLLAFVLLTAAAAWAVTATQADAGCGPCTGPRYNTFGTAPGCGSSATAAARANALLNAFGSPAGCIPCSVQNGNAVCALPSGGNPGFTTAQISYKCQGGICIPPRPDLP